MRADFMPARTRAVILSDKSVMRLNCPAAWLLTCPMVYRKTGYAGVKVWVENDSYNIKRVCLGKYATLQWLDGKLDPIDAFWHTSTSSTKWNNLTTPNVAPVNAIVMNHFMSSFLQIDVRAPAPRDFRGFTPEGEFVV